VAEAEKDQEQAADAEPVPAVLQKWEQVNRALVSGTEPVREIAVAPSAPDMLDAAGIWGDELPDDLAVALEPAALAAAIRVNGYLVDGGETGRRWAEALAGCRAVVLPDQARLTPDQETRVRDFVKRGGTLIAFGHGGFPVSGALNYALPNLLAVEYRGLVEFETEATRVTVTGDSIWAPQYKPENVIDGAAETFWASVEGGPMPHWVEIAFAAAQTVGGAEVKCRPGFLLKDFQVQCTVGGEWVTCAHVTDNTDWIIDCPFEKPVETDLVRLYVTREHHQDKDRVIADVGEFMPYGRDGKRLITPPYLLEARIRDEPWAKALHSDRLPLRSPAVRVEPAEGTVKLFVYPELPRPEAQVLAAFPDPLAPSREVPLCTRSVFGKGTAYLLTVPEGALGEEPHIWEALLRTFVGMPAVRHSGDENVLAFLRKGKGRYVLSIVDTAPVDSADRAKEVIVRLNSGALGPVKSVSLAPDGGSVETKTRDEWLQFTAPMDPMANILLRTR
jgi:hypothetical protein